MLRPLFRPAANGQGILGTHLVGKPAADLPTGFPLAGLLSNDVDAADAPGTLYRVEFLDRPAAGVLDVSENGAGSFTGAPDGVYSGTTKVYKNDVADTGSYRFQIGASVAPPPDTAKPSFTGALAHTKTSTSITVDWLNTVSADNVAVARREYRLGGSGPYTPATSLEETSKRHTFTGLAPNTGNLIEVRCVDTSENVSDALTITVTTSAAPAPSGDGFNHIRYDLVTKGEVPHLSLATLDWSLFAQLRVKDLSAPIVQGTHTMVAGSSLLDIAVSAAAVPAGWYFLILADADGTTTAAAPVLVA